MAYRCAGIPHKAVEGIKDAYCEPKDSLGLIGKVMSYLSLIVAVLVFSSAAYGLASGLQMTNSILLFLFALIAVLLTMGFVAKAIPRKRISIVREDDIYQVYCGKRRVAKLDIYLPTLCHSKSSVIVFPTYMRKTKAGKNISSREYATWIRLTIPGRNSPRYCLLQIDKNASDASSAAKLWSATLNLSHSEYSNDRSAPKTIHVSCPEWSKTE